MSDQLVDLTNKICRYRAETLPPSHRHNFQLAASYGQEPGLPFSRRPKDGVGCSKDDAEYWLRVVAPAAFAAGYGDSSPEKRRTLMWSCRLLGLGWGAVTKAINDVRMFGSAEAAEAWHKHMKPVDQRYVGFVYSAVSTRDQSIVKIGFSTRAEKRVVELSRIEGFAVDLISRRPGTILHEWALHTLIPFAVRSEWYPREQVPAWLLGEAA